MQVKNVCYDNFMFQNDDIFFIENNSLFIGVLKVEVTFVVVLAEMKLRLFEKWGINN